MFKLKYFSVYFDQLAGLQLVLSKIRLTHLGAGADFFQLASNFSVLNCPCSSIRKSYLQVSRGKLIEKPKGGRNTHFV